MEDELNEHVQEAIRRKDWSIVSINLEDNPESLSRETFKMMAEVFDGLLLEEISQGLIKKGRPNQAQRDMAMVCEFRTLLAAVPKENTSASQHKTQAKQKILKEHKITWRAFDKALERYEAKELRRAQNLTYGVDLNVLIGSADHLESLLVSEGFSPGSGHKVIESVKGANHIIEREKRKKRRGSVRIQ